MVVFGMFPLTRSQLHNRIALVNTVSRIYSSIRPNMPRTAQREAKQPVKLPHSDSPNAELSPELAAIIPEEFAEEDEIAPQPATESPESAEKTKRGPPTRPLPTPRLFALPPEEFFAYWWSMKKDNRVARVTVYPYRLWPVCDVLLELPVEEQERIRKLKALKKKAGPPTNIGLDTTIEPFDPNNWEQEVYHRYGAGDYNFKLNDTDPKHMKTVCMTTVRGLRDWDHYPPTCRPEIVVLTDPANKTYIDWARRNGVHFPGDPPTPEMQSANENEMAEQKSSETLAATVDKLADRLTRQQQAPAPVQQTDNGIVQVFGKMLEVMQQQQAAQMQQQTTQMNAILQRLEQSERKPTESMSQLDTTKAVIDMAKTIIPPPAPPAPPAPPPERRDDPMIALLMQMRKEDHERHMKEMEAMTKRLESNDATIKEILTKQATPATTSPSTNGEFKILDRFFEYKERFDKITNGGGDNTPGWVPAALQGGEMLLNAAQNITSNIAAMRAGAKPLPPVPLTNDAIEGPQEQAAPTPQQQEEERMNLMDQVAQMVHPELVAALKSGMPGHEFAGRLIFTYGHIPQFQTVYNGLLASGPNGVVGEGGFLRRSGKRWGELVEHGAKLEKFVNEFLDVQKANEVAAALRQANQPKPAPVATPAPAPKPNGAVTPEIMPKPRVRFGPDGVPLQPPARTE